MTLTEQYDTRLSLTRGLKTEALGMRVQGYGDGTRFVIADGKKQSRC